MKQKIVYLRLRLGSLLHGNALLLDLLILGRGSGRHVDGGRRSYLELSLGLDGRLNIAWSYAAAGGRQQR